MHRGCVSFISRDQFASHYWPTLKPLIEEFWAAGHQTLFYAEGNWDAHLEQFAELPDGSIVFHMDQSSVEKVHHILGHKFCLSGGIPNALLAYGSPDEVRAYCKKVIDTVAADGGYIMDASAIVQNDATVENMRALTDFTREYGVYSQAAADGAKKKARAAKAAAQAAIPEARVKPGVCVPWAEKRKELPRITGDEDLVKRVWEANDALGYLYIWQCLLSF